MIISPDGDFPTIQSKKPSENSLYEGLKQYGAKGFYPFHMPGHKGASALSDTFLKEALPFDLTETEGLDNLHSPHGLIAESQKKAARLFGAAESYFLVNGATAGIIAAVSAVGREGEILGARNSHRSFYSGLVFSGAKAAYLYPRLTNEGFPGGISPQDVEEALSSNKNISALFITSPTYEGFSSDLKEIAGIAHRHNKLLIVDEAHGAHFIFHPGFPESALESGADIVIQSLHKTLPALTQSAILHVQGDLADRARLKEALSMIQTSSPSYLLMASISRCIDILSREAGPLFQAYYHRLTSFREDFCANGRLRLLGNELEGKHGIKKIDPGKLIFMTDSGLTGRELSLRLQDYQIQVEMYGFNHVLAMTGICDTDSGFALLKKGIEEISSGLKAAHNPRRQVPPPLPPMSPVKTLRQAFYAKKRSLPFEESEGCVSGEFIIPYPPGIPLVAPGELITREAIEKASACHKAGIPLIGMEKEALIRICV